MFSPSMHATECIAKTCLTGILLPEPVLARGTFLIDHHATATDHRPRRPYAASCSRSIFRARCARESSPSTPSGRVGPPPRARLDPRNAAPPRPGTPAPVEKRCAATSRLALYSNIGAPGPASFRQIRQPSRRRRGHWPTGSRTPLCRTQKRQRRGGCDAIQPGTIV